MRPIRLLISVSSCILAVTFFLYLGNKEPSDSLEDGNDGSKQKKARLGSLFSFRGPLFPPSAIISLTDDNSTFFLSRPAAFGPLLPAKGLSGPLWVGRGFGSDRYGQLQQGTQSQGELGCDDVPESDEAQDAGDESNGDSDTRHTAGSDGQVELGGSNAIWPNITGKIALLTRGGCGFLDKVLWAQNRGATAVVVGDNVRGGPIITMYARGDTSNVTIPALFTSRTTAHLLSTLVDTSGRIESVTGRRGSQRFAHGARRAWTEYASDHRLFFTGKSRSWTEMLASRVRLALSKKSYTSLLRDRAQDIEFVSKEDLPHPKRAADSDDDIRSTTRSSNRWEQSSYGVLADHEGLWITLTPTNMSSSPFLDTLLVLVVSPLITLTVVYALLVLRARVQRRRWRAPKSIVDRLPVRTYRTLPGSSSQVATPLASSPTTPLLSSFQDVGDDGAAPTRAADENNTTQASASESTPPAETRRSEREKAESGLNEWRRKYGGRQKECVVCLEEYVDGVSRVMGLPCGHEFHAECITPWLTRRRRTCPICKGDVVRSLARSSRSARSRSPRRGFFARRRPASSRGESFSSSSSSEASFAVADDEIQTQAATRRNDSPSAAIPIPTEGNDMARYDAHGDDLERGVDVSSAPEARPRTDGSNIWRRVGSLGLPSFLGGARSGSPNQREDRRTR